MVTAGGRGRACPKPRALPTQPSPGPPGQVPAVPSWPCVWAEPVQGSPPTRGVTHRSQGVQGSACDGRPLLPCSPCGLASLRVTARRLPTAPELLCRFLGQRPARQSWCWSRPAAGFNPLSHAL